MARHRQRQIRPANARPAQTTGIPENHTHLIQGTSAAGEKKHDRRNRINQHNSGITTQETHETAEKTQQYQQDK
eukprot:3708091-Prorocentrum_lima.AAC.1